jgi:hypothetical protein
MKRLTPLRVTVVSIMLIGVVASLAGATFAAVIAPGLALLVLLFGRRRGWQF